MSIKAAVCTAMTVVGIASGSMASVSMASVSMASASESATLVTDSLGTHDSTLVEAAWIIESDGRKVQPESCASGEFSGGSRVSLSNGFTDLVIRQDACRSAAATGNFTTGQVRRVDHTTHGEFICRGRSYGYGTDNWHHLDGIGYAWAGGTDTPGWDLHHGC